jgi:ATP synthase, F0 subunit b
MYYSASGNEEAGSDGLAVVLPPIYEIFWSAIIFIGLWIVLGLSLKKIYAMIDKRTAEIESGLDAAQVAKDNAALAQRERKDMLRAANEEARSLREQASQDAQRIVSGAKAEAQAEAQRISENAEKQIASERHAAEVALRKDVGTMATELAEKIVGEKLKDDEVSARVIDRFMDELEADIEPVGAKVK